MREVIREGRNVEEAIDAACEELGVERGQANFEILELPKTTLFGLRKKPAKVRVYLEDPVPEKKQPPKKKPEPPKPPVRETRRPEAKQPPVSAPNKGSEPYQGPKKGPEPAVAPKPSKKPEPEAPKPVMTAKEREFPPVPPPSFGERKPDTMENTDETADRPSLKFIPMEEVQGEKPKVACAYVASILTEMGANAKITVAETESGIVIRLTGEGLGVIIGRRGETLDALQYLTGLVANRCEGDYLRITIDTGNYREKRERTLQQLARKLSASALRTGRSSMLEPMNPYERRIIHSTVSQIEGVTSSSIGEEPNRRVVISPVNARPRPPRKGSAPRRGGPGPGPGTGPRRNGPREDGPYRGGPRREPRPPRENNFRSREEQAHVTSTAVDREYAKELEREPAFVKPEQPQVREKPVVRDKPKDEGENLPLYGKIEL